MNLIRSSTQLFISKFLDAIVTFLGVAYFARVLGSSAMGSFFLFQALLALLAIPADLGIRRAVEKRLSEGGNQKNVLTTAFVLKLGPLFVLSCTIFLLRNIINEYIGAVLSLYLILAIVLQDFSRLLIHVLQGEHRVGETASIRLMQRVIWVCGGVVLLALNYGVASLVYSLLGGFTFTIAAGLYKRSTPFTRPSVSAARSLFSYSQYSLVSNLGGYVYSWMDVIIIGIFLSQAEVGAYEIAWRMTVVVVLLSKAIGTSIFPQVSEWDAQGSTEDIERIIQHALFPSLAIVIPAFFGTMILSHEILRIIFGNQYTIAWFVLIILMGEKIIQAIHEIFGRVLQGVDRPDLAARASVISVGVNIVANIILVLSFGINGVAIATLLSFGLNAFLHGRYLSQLLRIQFPYREVAWSVFASGIMAIMILTIQLFVHIDSVLSLAFIVCAGAVSYFIVLTVSQPIRMKISKHMKRVAGA